MKVSVVPPCFRVKVGWDALNSRCMPAGSNLNTSLLTVSRVKVGLVTQTLRYQLLPAPPPMLLLKLKLLLVPHEEDDELLAAVRSVGESRYGMVFLVFSSCW